MDNNHFIYAWVDPITNSPFYIGQGKHQPRSKYARAYAKHFNRTRKNAYCQNKADKLSRLGNPHKVEILYDNLTIEMANELEESLICIYGRINNGTGILTNLSDGGEVNPMNDPIIRKKQLEAVNSPEHRANKSAKSKANSQRPEWIEWNRNMMKAKMNDPEYYSKWYDKFTSEENIEKLRSTHIGHSIEFNGKIYRSKRELARFLGISSQLLLFRLKNNIQLDLIPDKANRKGKDF